MLKINSVNFIDGYDPDHFDSFLDTLKESYPKLQICNNKDTNYYHLPSNGIYLLFYSCYNQHLLSALMTNRLSNRTFILLFDSPINGFYKGIFSRLSDSFLNMKDFLDGTC